MLRQEDISVEPQSRPAVHGQMTIEAQISARVFLGARTRYVARVGNRDIRVFAPRTALFNPGDKVRLGWAEEAVRWLETE